MCIFFFKHFSNIFHNTYFNVAVCPYLLAAFYSILLCIQYFTIYKSSLFCSSCKKIVSTKLMELNDNISLNQFCHFWFPSCSHSQSHSFTTIVLLMLFAHLLSQKGILLHGDLPQYEWKITPWWKLPSNKLFILDKYIKKIYNAQAKQLSDLVAKLI